MNEKQFDLLMEYIDIVVSETVQEDMHANDSSWMGLYGPEKYERREELRKALVTDEKPKTSQ